MVVVYSKKNCQPCRATLNYLAKKDIIYKYRDITDDLSAQDRLRDEGWSSMPVVVTDTTSWSGYRPDLLEKL